MSTTDFPAVRSTLRGMVENLRVVALTALECHWNVSGPHFGPLHALFGSEYEFALATQDTLAERIRALGGLVPASGGTPSIKYEQVATSTPEKMLAKLLGNYTQLITEFRAAITRLDPLDSVTANLLQEICASFEKHAWMIRMHVTTP